MIGERASARNIDLSTVPRRDSVQLTIYNSEDITLVREMRTITFKKGVNPLQLSWANTLIDPSSVQLRFLKSADKLDVLDTTFPHDKPQMLYWNVQSEIDGEAAVEITYFTSGISWSADYTAIADKDEKKMTLESFVRITNGSGEEYEDAQVRLVVGTINLVEKVAKLTNISPADFELMEKGEKDKLEKKAATEYFRKMPAGKGMGGGGGGGRGGEPEMDEKKIVKEGLSEYFIYTIEGTETIPNGWSKRMRSFEAKSVPFKIQYRYRPAEYGDQLVRMYLLTNNTESKLGTTPLPNGIVRVFRDNGRNGLSYLAAQAVKYIPIGDKIELNLGADPSVIFELIKLKSWRDEIWMWISGAEVLRRVGQPGVQIDVNSSVAGWDDHEIYTQRVRNYTAKAIEVEIRRPFAGHVVFRSQLKPTLFDFQTPQFTALILAGQKADLLFEIVRHEGRNAKQNNVTLEEGIVGSGK